MSIAYLFPGQGSHSVGMGKAVADAYPVAAEVFEHANDILGIDLRSLCFDGPIDTLTETHNQQPALFVTSIATLEAMRAEGEPAPQFLAGHSLGEFSALVAAGVFSFEDGLRLVRLRGEAMTRAGQKEPGAMIAVLGLDTGAVEAICQQASDETGQRVQLANDNCPGQIVLSGQLEAVERAETLSTEAKARRVVRLPLSIAAHSHSMRFAAEELANAIEDVSFSEPTLPIVGNTTGSLMTNTQQIIEELNAQLTGPVLWTKSMQTLIEQGVGSVYEVGAGDVLRKLMKRIDRSVARNGFDIKPTSVG